MFTENVADLQVRYEAISERLRGLDISYFTGFMFLKNGIKVQNAFFPLVKMPWQEGQPLNVFVSACLDDGVRLQNLLESFLDLVRFLSHAGLAHGDLQHGNILVHNEALYLVDYDGMYVPALRSLKSRELGHRNYQSPRRTADHFGPYLDNFSAWVIYTSLLVACRDASLWNTLGAGDEAMLFKQQDFIFPDKSHTFNVLRKHKDREIQNAAEVLTGILNMDPSLIAPVHKAVSRS